MQMLNIHIVPGKQAPKYPHGVELQCECVTVTENGTELDLPIVDFVMTGPHGEKYLLVLTGRIVNAIASAVRGVNVKNHGKEDP